MEVVKQAEVSLLVQVQALNKVGVSSELILLKGEEESVSGSGDECLKIIWVTGFRHQQGERF